MQRILISFHDEFGRVNKKVAMFYFKIFFILSPGKNEVN